MLKGFVFGILATVIVGAAGAYLAITSGVIPANADGPPLPLETWAASTSLDATLKREAPKGPNPVALTDANLIAGIKLYSDNCAFCHGTSKGEASATSVAKGEYPPPPQLAADGVEDDPEGYSFWKMKHGIRLTGMPSWKDALNDQQIWTLALFLKHMDKLPPAAQLEWAKVQN
jgi:mono/diheme cytochrome c family protein